MANQNFIVQNGINVGGKNGATIGISSSTGALTITPPPSAAYPNPVAQVFHPAGTSTTVSTKNGGDLDDNDVRSAVVATGVVLSGGTTTANSSTSFGNISVSAITGGTSGNLILTGSVLPSANVTYGLGSRTMMWKDVYVGPGTLYINGTPVLGASTTGTPTINFTASAGQNIAVATNGGGVLQLDGGSAGGGYIQVKSPLQIAAGSNITSSDGNAIAFANQIAVDSITSRSTNSNYTISASGTGIVAINKDTVITGNLTVNGTTEIINTSVLNVTTQFVNLNSGVTGTPTLDAGLKVVRGSSNNAVLRWSESAKAWQTSIDNVTFANIITSSTIPSGSLTFTGDVTGSGTTGGSTQLTLASSGATAGTYGSTTQIPVINVDAKGRITSVSSVAVTTGQGGAVQYSSVTVNSISKSGNNGSGDIGQSNNTFATVYATTFSGVSTTAQYADLAENYQGDKTYAAGTVVMFGGAQEVTVADADTRAVAGVVSTNPAHLMNGSLTGANVVPVALQGRVPCMVIGPVKKGDMLVSAGYGYAKSCANPQMGQVIGKALYDFPGSSKAVIEVVVGRI